MTAMDGRRPMFANIDDYLGDGATRFFGAGYRRAEYQIRDVIVSPARHEATDPAGRADRPAVRASVTVRYPRDWSTKAENIDLRPHLSSIDTLLLGVQLGEAYLAHALGADEDVRARARLRRVTLQAGTEPQEDLTDLPAVAVLSRSETVQEEPDLVRSVFDCRIGAMRSRCEIEHERLEPPGGTARPDAGAYPTIDDVLGPPDTRYYGDGFRFRRLLIEDIRADLDALTADATVRTERVEGAPAPRRGREGGGQPGGGG
ncbi:MAG: hypothetical protein IRY90_18960, partial [Actinomadura rubrobrunea]|nr:hypothetical protein [Actinomadura rubrobrunea]